PIDAASTTATDGSHVNSVRTLRSAATTRSPAELNSGSGMAINTILTAAAMRFEGSKKLRGVADGQARSRRQTPRCLVADVYRLLPTLPRLIINAAVAHAANRASVPGSGTALTLGAAAPPITGAGTGGAKTELADPTYRFVPSSIAAGEAMTNVPPSTF